MHIPGCSPNFHHETAPVRDNRSVQGFWFEYYVASLVVDAKGKSLSEISLFASLPPQLHKYTLLADKIETRSDRWEHLLEEKDTSRVYIGLHNMLRWDVAVFLQREPKKYLLLTMGLKFRKELSADTMFDNTLAAIPHLGFTSMGKTTATDNQAKLGNLLQALNSPGVQVTYLAVSINCSPRPRYALSSPLLWKSPREPLYILVVGSGTAEAWEFLRSHTGLLDHWAMKAKTKTKASTDKFQADLFQFLSTKYRTIVQELNTMPVKLPREKRVKRRKLQEQMQGMEHLATIIGAPLAPLTLDRLGKRMTTEEEETKKNESKQTTQKRRKASTEGTA